MTGKAHWYGAKEPQQRGRYTVWVGASSDTTDDDATSFDCQGYVEDCVVDLAQAVGEWLVEGGPLTRSEKAAVRLAAWVIRKGARR